MRLVRRLTFTLLAGAAFAPAVASAQVGEVIIPVEPVPNASPPRTWVEDVRERYRAMRAASKPTAETVADLVETGEGSGVRRIEPVDPELDPSSDTVLPPHTPRTAALDHPSLPPYFDRLELVGPVRTRMVSVSDDYDGRMNRLLAEFDRVHARAVAAEAALLAERLRTGAAATAPAAPSRTTGFRPGDGVDPIEVNVVESPFAGPSADLWKRLYALHLQAVRLEADRLLALERLLTPQQLERLHGFRTLAAPAVAPPAPTPAEQVRRAGQEIERERNGGTVE